MLHFPSLSPIQQQHLKSLIKDDLSVLEWEMATYGIKAFYQDKKGWMYKMRFTFNNGWLCVIVDHPLGGGFKHVWDQEGERIKC